MYCREENRLSVNPNLLERVRGFSQPQGCYPHIKPNLHIKVVPHCVKTGQTVRKFVIFNPYETQDNAGKYLGAGEYQDAGSTWMQGSIWKQGVSGLRGYLDTGGSWIQRISGCMEHLDAGNSWIQGSIWTEESNWMGGSIWIEGSIQMEENIWKGVCGRKSIHE